METTEKVNFTVDPDFITDFIRNCALDPNMRHAWKVLKSVNNGFSDKELKPFFLEILEGKKSFVSGNNEGDLQLVNSNNENIMQKILNHICYAEDVEELEFYHSIKPLQKYQRQEFKLRKIESNDYKNTDWAWITKSGIFLPVEFQGHRQKLDDIREDELVDEDCLIGENHWIKITTHPHIFCLGREMTPEQKDTLINFLDTNKEWYFKGDNELEIQGYGYAHYSEENGSITLESYFEEEEREASLLRPKYIGNPKDRVVRIGLNQATKLYKQRKAIFIYLDGKYQQVKSLDSRHTNNQTLFVQKKDLY